MNIRKIPLENGETYHIFNKSIADFRIFSNSSGVLRMIETIKYYQKEDPPFKFSRFIKLDKNEVENFTNLHSKKENLVEIIAYCIMPTHLHLILKQTKKYGISIFMNHVLNSYTRYFNTRQRRKGPLWEGYFKNVLIETDEQLLHLTRYIHLNPVTAYLIDNPKDWFASSYKEYLSEVTGDNKICNYADFLEIKPNLYKDFVEGNISHQRELAGIKDLLLE